MFWGSDRLRAPREARQADHVFPQSRNAHRTSSPNRRLIVTLRYADCQGIHAPASYRPSSPPADCSPQEKSFAPSAGAERGHHTRTSLLTTRGECGDTCARRSGLWRLDLSFGDVLSLNP